VESAGFLEYVDAVLLGIETPQYSFLNGQCHEIFDFRFFSWTSFPQAPEYTFTAISLFLEHLRRYLRLKVHHRCQMEKIFNRFIYSQDQSTLYIFPPAEQADPSWEYIIRSQTHECGNWDWGPNIPFSGIICFKIFGILSLQCGVIDTGGKFASGITLSLSHPSPWTKSWRCL
jgi:hypothetical protein